MDVEGTGTFPKEGLCDTAMDWDITCTYDSGVKIRYRAQPAPEEWKARYGEVSEHGTAFEGTEGWVHVDRSHIRTYPENLVDSVIGPDEVHLYESKHHLRNFVECVKSRKEPVSPIDTAVEADIICHICDIAIRLERKVRWDPLTEKFINGEAANARLSRPMRSPWHL